MWSVDTAATLSDGLEPTGTEREDCLLQLDRDVAEFLVGTQPNLLPAVAALHAALRSGHLCCHRSGTRLFDGARAVWKGNAVEWDALKQGGIVCDDHNVYLPKAWKMETMFLEELLRVCSHTPDAHWNPEKLSELLRQTPLTPEQIAAVEGCVAQPLAIISGGPGSGKSFTAGHMIRTILELAPKRFEVVVAAPTGKAAARLQAALGQAVNVEPTTLHRLLNVVPGRRRQAGYLTADLLLVDESSMLDVTLFTQLLASVKPGARLVLLGDSDQLPPVDCGSLFHDLMQSAQLGQAAVRLPGSQRTDKADLLTLARAALDGDVSTLREQVTHEIQDAEQAARWLQHNAFPALSGEEVQQQLEVLSARGVLSPMRHGPLGTVRLNELAYEKELERPGERCALPIMVTRNYPHLGLYNGDTGIVRVWKRPYRWLFPFRSSEVAYFMNPEGQVRELPAQLLPAVDLAYCLSIHKSQGSEWDAVTLVFPEGADLFGRSALYTGITRARAEVQLVADIEALNGGLGKEGLRRSGVIHRLEQNQSAALK